MNEPSVSEQAVTQLIEGNQRFARNQFGEERSDVIPRLKTATGQQPNAIILGCVDSRVAPEIIFDQALGDLLVIRTAGEVLDAAALGSIEFGIAMMGIPLVIVLGHTECGAIQATITAMQDNSTPPGKIGYLVNSLRPVVNLAGGAHLSHLNNAAKLQVEFTIKALKESPVIAQAIDDKKLRLEGAIYDLTNGKVNFIQPQ